MVTHYFGEYNHIYFVLGDGGRIVAVRDRAHRKPPVEFIEAPLVDHDGDRTASELTFEMAHRDEPGQFTVAGTVLNGSGPEHYRGPTGFGRSLRYRVVDPPAPYTLVTALTVRLPERVQYRVRWNATGHTDNRFTLAPDTVVTVLTDLPWQWSDSTVVVETGDAAGEVTFLVTSGAPAGRLRDIVLVTAQGHERDALLVRAACGRGFVPSFVVTAAHATDAAYVHAMLNDVPHRVVLGVGLPTGHALADVASALVEVPTGGDASTPLRGYVGREPSELTIRAPDRPELYGPALYLAMRQDADLALDTSQVDEVTMIDSHRGLVRRWESAELLGTVLPPDQTRGGDQLAELVICESTLARLVVCQAVGYADLRSCPIAFVPPAPAGVTAGDFPDASTGLAALEAHRQQSCRPR